MTQAEAFDIFMRDNVNLDPEQVQAARKSRDNLLDIIVSMSGQGGFLKIYSRYNLHFGSFGRKTQCRELDDIDLMICIAANGAMYFSTEDWYNMHIKTSASDLTQKQYDVGGYLSSTIILNAFKKQLENVYDYSRSEIRRDNEAVVLNLKSKTWSFDIVPCFITDRDFYLIPNSKGHWKKTDPRIDRDIVTKTNQFHRGRLLELIRLCKKWSEQKHVIKFPSYLLETMLINYANSCNILDPRLDVRFCEALSYIGRNIIDDVNDLKNIQGNINTLSILGRLTIQSYINEIVSKGICAHELEDAGHHTLALQKWSEIFGDDFPHA